MQDAAESSAASPLVDAAPRGPLRTCVGCRSRAAAADLLRVVVEAAEPGQPGRLRLDLRRSAPGRGAWLHPDPRCAELAERRRAFARALRVPAVTDASAVVALIAAGHARPSGPQSPHGNERTVMNESVQHNRSSNRLAGRSRPTGDHEGEKKS